MRLEEVVTSLVAAHGHRDIKALRAFARAHLQTESQLKLYDDYRARYLMLDAFPQEASRFPLDSTTLRRLVYGA